MSQSNMARESGSGLIEVMFGAIVLVVAILGSASGLATGLIVATETKAANLANDAAITVIEDFRTACTADFNTALKNYDGLQSEIGVYTVNFEVILDETRFSPGIDLNGDGDTDDANLSPAEVNAVYVSAVVDWGNNKSINFVNLLARAEVAGG